MKPDTINLLTANGYAVSRRSEFEKSAPAEIIKRAKEQAIQYGGYSWVLWDPNDDSNGVLIVGDSQNGVVDAAMEHLGQWLTFPERMTK